MASAERNSNPGSEPELHFLLSDTFEPLWKSLLGGFNEFFFPESLPPLKLESKPIPVKDVWGFYSYKKKGALGSTAVHALVLGLIIGAAFVKIRRPVPPTPPLRNRTKLIVSDFPLPIAKTQTGGGGGGGDGDPLPASVGRLPKASMQQITPPAAVIRNPAPELPVAPTVIAPPDIEPAVNANVPDVGDPKSTATIPSNGPGTRSGIGDGSDGGDGPGRGRGVGLGDEAGKGGGDVFRFGKGVTAPRVIYQTDPEFSEEARKAKFQGNCVLGLVVDVNGRPTNIHVLNALGMGLDEKAIESVKNWKFEPGKRNGHDVAVEIAVEVDFHLY